jgi:hypothetical protein
MCSETFCMSVYTLFMLSACNKNSSPVYISVRLMSYEDHNSQHHGHACKKYCISRLSLELRKKLHTTDRQEMAGYRALLSMTVRTAGSNQLTK